MKITLRKANTVQVAINDALKGLEFTDSVSINEFQTVDSEIASAVAKFYNNVSRRIDLLDALYEIRKAVSGANYNASIDSTLADIARLEKDIQFFSTYAKGKVQESELVLNGKLDKIRNRKEETYYGRSDDLTTSLFITQDIDKFQEIVSIARKQKQKLQDTLLEANVRTEIELSERSVTTLAKENII